MRKVYFGTIPAFQFHNLQKFSDQVEHGVFCRRGGFSEPPFDSLNLSFSVDDKAANVSKNRWEICKRLKFPPENLLAAHQVHGKNIIIVDEKYLSMFEAETEVADVDGFITNLKNVGLMAKSADCQAIMMFDPVKKVAAAVHAGWKGLAKDISGEAVRIMRQKFGVDPKNLLVGISPSLGPCCAFFSNPELELPNEFHRFIDDEKRVDLWNFSVEQLMKHGIRQSNIELARVCTMCGAGNKFFSFRRDRGITGRNGSVIFLR
jgi:hypothetical protein